ncbi:MAG: TetR/AcrR family transcriptional regulator [Pseudomonadota bacterium]
MSITQHSEDTRAAFGIKTKGRILSASLDLFNAFGFERVTTAQLAEAADVLDGTLWYHFKAKKDLPLAHLDVLEARLNDHLESPMATARSEVVDAILGMFDLLWDFRYLLRDPIAVVQDGEDSRARLKRIYQNVEQRTQDRLHQADALGLIDLDGVDVHSLAVSCFLVGRYWLDYASIRYGEDMDAATFRQMGIAQIVSLIRPYVTEGGNTLLNASPQPADDAAG